MEMNLERPNNAQQQQNGRSDRKPEDMEKLEMQVNGLQLDQGGPSNGREIGAENPEADEDIPEGSVRGAERKSPAVAQAEMEEEERMIGEEGEEEGAALEEMDAEGTVEDDEVEGKDEEIRQVPQNQRQHSNVDLALERTPMGQGTGCFLSGFFRGLDVAKIISSPDVYGASFKIAEGNAPLPKPIKRGQEVAQLSTSREKPAEQTCGRQNGIQEVPPKSPEPMDIDYQMMDDFQEPPQNLHAGPTAETSHKAARDVPEDAPAREELQRVPSPRKGPTPAREEPSEHQNVNSNAQFNEESDEEEMGEEERMAGEEGEEEEAPLEEMEAERIVEENEAEGEDEATQVPPNQRQRSDVDLALERTPMGQQNGSLLPGFYRGLDVAKVISSPDVYRSPFKAAKPAQATMAPAANVTEQPDIGEMSTSRHASCQSRDDVPEPMEIDEMMDNLQEPPQDILFEPIAEALQEDVQEAHVASEESPARELQREPLPRREPTPAREKPLEHQNVDSDARFNEEPDDEKEELMIERSTGQMKAIQRLLQGTTFPLWQLTNKATQEALNRFFAKEELKRSTLEEVDAIRDLFPITGPQPKKGDVLLITLYPSQILFGHHELELESGATISFIVDEMNAFVELKLSDTRDELINMKDVLHIAMTCLEEGFPPCLTLEIRGIEKILEQISPKFELLKSQGKVVARDPVRLFVLLGSNPESPGWQCKVTSQNLESNHEENWDCCAKTGFHILKSQYKRASRAHQRTSPTIYNFIKDFWDLTDLLGYCWIHVIDNWRGKERWMIKSRKEVQGKCKTNFLRLDVATGMAHWLHPPTHRDHPLQRRYNTLDGKFEGEFSLQFQMDGEEDGWQGRLNGEEDSGLRNPETPARVRYAPTKRPSRGATGPATAPPAPAPQIVQEVHRITKDRNHDGSYAGSSNGVPRYRLPSPEKFEDPSMFYKK